MVSHRLPPPAYSDLAPPAPTSQPPPTAARASSVTSGRSATRRHRHARTHHGGTTAYTPQNEFPVFSHTGDVEIVVASRDGRRENRYLLHRLILSQCSGFFEAGTRIEWSGRAIEAGGNSLARIDENASVGAASSSRASSQERRSSFDQGKRRWRYELDWTTDGEDEMPMLVQKDSTPSSIFGGGDSYNNPPSSLRPKPPTGNEGFFRSMTNFSALNLSDRPQPSVPPADGDEVLKDYDNLFRTMYQYPPALDTLNIATAYTEAKALLHLADMYDALEVVGSRVDHHLLRFGGRLFKQIAKYPPSYLKLGYLARSRTIFTEALIHVVGQWPLGAPQIRGQLDANVMDLVEDKVDEQAEMRERVEAKLWRLALTTGHGERVTPSNDFLGWLAISLFRQWLAENTTLGPTSILKETQPNNAGANGQHARTASNSSSAHVASQRITNPSNLQHTSQQPAPFNPGRIYRLLGSTNPASYLGHDELKRFLKLSPDQYTRENLRRFERRMDEVKHLAQEVVKPLMRNFLELDLGTVGPAGLGYLTCCRLDDAEIPWDD